MKKLKSLLNVRKIYRMSIARIRNLCDMMRVDERINESILYLSSHIERIVNSMIAKNVYNRDCTGDCRLCRPQKGGLIV